MMLELYVQFIFARHNSRYDGRDDQGEPDEAGVVGALLAPRRVLRFLGVLCFPDLDIQAIQCRVRLRNSNTILGFPVQANAQVAPTGLFWHRNFFLRT